MGFLYLGEVVQRLDDVSLDGELEQDQLLSESFLRLAAELQHLPAVKTWDGHQVTRHRAGASVMQRGDVTRRDSVS